MGNTSETAAIMEEKNPDQNWTQQKEQEGGDVEELLFEEDQLSEYSTTRSLKRKAKKKDEGPLEIFCGMIVDHQIGTSSPIVPIGKHTFSLVEIQDCRSISSSCSP